MNKIKNIIIKVICIIIYSINIGCCKKKHPVKEKSVLFIRMDNIGDFILWLNAAQKICSFYHNEKKILICKSNIVEIAMSVKFWDMIIGIDEKMIKKDIKYAYKIINKLKKLSINKVFNVQYSRTRLLEILISFIFAEEKFAMGGEIGRLGELENKIYNRQYKKVFCISNETMELQKNISFLNFITKNNFKNELFYLPKQTDLSKNLFDNYFVIFPGGSYESKSWSEENYSELIENIINSNNIYCYICGSEGEEKIGHKIIENVKNNRIYSLIGKTNIMELIEIIRNAKFLIGNDTSGVHIASATATPSIAIGGWWQKGRFLPYITDNKEEKFLPRIIKNELYCEGCANRGHMAKECDVIVHNKENKRLLCMEKVTVKMVIREFEKINNQIDF